MAADGNIAGRTAHAIHFGARVTHDGADVDVELIEGPLHAAQHPAVLAVHAFREIAGRHAIGKTQQALQRLGRHDAQSPGSEQAHAQHHSSSTGKSSQRQCRQTPRCQDAGRHTDGADQNGQGGDLGIDTGIQQTTDLPAPVVFVQCAVPQAVYQLARLLFSAHRGKQGFERLYLLPRGLGAHRQIGHRLFAVHHRRDVGDHPIVVAVFAAVLHQPGPGHALAKGVPQVTKSFLGHIRVAHQVVRLAQQFFFAKAAEFDEDLVAVGDAPLQVGGRNHRLAGWEGVFALRNR